MDDGLMDPCDVGREPREPLNAFSALRAFVGTEEALSVLNGVFGDLLEERRSRLAMPMTFRCGGAELRLEREALADQLVDATGSVCVFVPGLMSSDSMWRFPARAETTYGSRLAVDRGVTPVFLSYNSGRHISSNGEQLAVMLDALLTSWPVDVAEVSLVGHSMGGLVIRSASHYGGLYGHAWVKKVRRVFLLGAPLSGAPLEKALHLADCTLATIWNPVTRLVARLLRRRSSGVKDLRFGALVEEDWSGHDEDAFRWPHRTPVPLLATADHYVIASTIFDRSDHPAADILGDSLVTCFSARGQTLPTWRATLVADIHTVKLPGVGHLALAHHDAVYRQMLTWWASP